MKAKIDNVVLSKEYSFDDNTPKNLLSNRSILNWPVVYLLYNDEKIYIGETINVYKRMSQHLKNKDKRKLNNLRIISDKDFTKSATLDIESSLIELLNLDYENSVTNKRLPINENGGVSKHKYANLAEFSQNSIVFEQIWKKLREIQIASTELQILKNSNLFKFSPCKPLNSDQINARDLVLSFFGRNSEQGIKDKTFIIQGGAGTGKTILGLYLLKLLTSSDKELNFYKDYQEDEVEEENEPEYIQNIKRIRDYYGKRELKVAYVISMQSFNKTIKTVLSSNHKLGLKANMVKIANDISREHFDIVIVDEAHRLKRNYKLGKEKKAFEDINKKLGFSNDGDQLDWILHNSDYQILFYDEKQSVKPSDVEKQKFDAILNNTNRTMSFPLQTQMRLMSNIDYLGYIDDILKCEAKEKIDPGEDYILEFCETIDELENVIKSCEERDGLSRMVAGFSWPFKNSSFVDDNKCTNKKQIKDVIIENKEYYWNLTRTNWVSSSGEEEAIQQIGCIHTIQGYDLNYCGVIFGREIGYSKEKNEFFIRPEYYHDSAGKDQDEHKLKEHILNIYRVLLSRGIKGTYVYVSNDFKPKDINNDELKAYLKKYMKVHK